MKRAEALPKAKKINPVLKELFDSYPIKTMSDIYAAFEKKHGKLSYSERGMVENMIAQWYENGELSVSGDSVSLNPSPKPIKIVSFSSGFRTY